MLVYALARDRNERAGRALIPDAILEKPPSAELRPDQTGQRLAPGVRGARPDRRGLRRRRSLRRRTRGAGVRPRNRAPGGAAHRPQRVQAAASTSRRTRVAQGVRQGPAAPDHQPLARLANARSADAQRAVRGRGRARPRRLVLRRHVPARARRARRHHAVRLSGRAVRPRAGRRAAVGVPLPANGGRPTSPRARGHDRRRDPVRGLCDADRRAPVHVTVDVGVHHRLVCRVHPRRRSARVPSHAWPSSVGGDRDRGRRSVPPHGSRRSPRSRRTADARVRGAVRVPHRVHRRVRAPHPARRVHRHAARDGRGAVDPADRRGRRRDDHGARGVRGGVHRNRVLGDRAAAAALGSDPNPRVRAPR